MTELFLTVLEISASVSVMTLLLLLISPLLNRRYAAKWNYLIWIFLAVRLLIPWNGADGKSAADIFVQWKNRIVSERSQDAAVLPAETASRRVVVEIPAQMTEPIAASTEKEITLLDIGALVWMAGSVIFIAVHLISYAHYKRRVRRYGANVALGALFAEVKRELHIRKSLPIIEFPEAASPMIMGFWGPVLILPENDYSEEELYFILKHELVHLKRGDVCMKFLFMLANAVHWFNPFVWILQREAAVDMELSCDERVTKGADYAEKKAYTETLLSTLHKGCKRKTVLSTGFYGGKQVMKKRFRNILRKTGKKNGFIILACAAVLTVSAGTLVGCSIGKGTDENVSGEQTEEGAEQNMSAGGEIAGEDSAAESSMTGGETAYEDAGSRSDEAITILSPEGSRRASLVKGDRYFFYLPDGEWQKEEADMWQAVADEDVRIWVAHFEDGYPAERLLISDGYAPESLSTDDGFVIEKPVMAKQENGIQYRVNLRKLDEDVWCVFYSYPVEAASDWEGELMMITDTFDVLLPNEYITDTYAVSAQILGYVTDIGSSTVTIDRQDWVTSESEDWRPEYDQDAGFEIVDIEGEDITYPVRNDCKYFILENHQGESIEIDKEGFARYIQETDFPIFWALDVEDGKVVSFAEWYRP